MGEANDRVDGPSRRALLQAGLAAAAVVAGPRVASARASIRDTDRAQDDAGPGVPIEFLGLKAGLALGAWTVLEVRSHARAVALLVRGPDGDPYQLDILGRDPEARGIAHSRHYSVFLVNDGDGTTRSDEQRARGALAVGHYLRWAETRGSVPPLATLTDRLRDDPHGAFRIA